MTESAAAVSYTHLDVYKRQAYITYIIEKGVHTRSSHESPLFIFKGFTKILDDVAGGIQIFYHFLYTLGANQFAFIILYIFCLLYTSRCV